MNSVDFWNDKERADNVISSLNNLKKKIEGIVALKDSVDSDLEMLELLKEEDMGMCLGTIEELENKTIERQPDTEYVVKEEMQPENDNFSDTTYDFLDEYELIVKNCISTLASSDNEIWKKSAKRKLINTLEDAGIENGSREFEEVHKYVQLMVEYTIRMENEYKEILTA